LRSLFPATAIAALSLVGGAVSAQAPPALQSQGQNEAPAPGAAAGKDVLAQGECRLRYDSCETIKEGHVVCRGLVDLVCGETRIQADELEQIETERPDGTKSSRIVAKGNVVFMRGDERIAGERLEMDLDTGQGVFEQALGFVRSDVMVEARRIERVSANVYKIHGGRFTSCMQPNPRWGFTASRATIHVDDKIVAKNVAFRVKGVPILYFPYFYYPIEEDQRSTGLLIPHVGYSTLKGWNVGTGFFWAMGRSADQTFYADTFSKIGYGLGHELRYTLASASRANFRTYVYRWDKQDKWDYDIDWGAAQSLPGRFRAALQVRQYSDLLFQQYYQESFDRISSRTRRSSFIVQGAVKGNQVQLLADSSDTFFGNERFDSRVHQPTLRLSRSARKIGKTGLVLAYDARAERIGVARGEQDVKAYSRFELAPELSRPFRLSFLEFNPAIGVRLTRWGLSLPTLDEQEGLVAEPLSRRIAEGRMEIRGPTFSRVFDTPGNFYSERFKHVIGPEVTWRYVTPVENFDEIPKYDGTDYYVGTNQVEYALVQRLYAKRPGRSGKLEAWEFLTWRLFQTYYVQINENQDVYDPNFSSSAYAPGNVPDHNSPIQSRLRFRPTRDLTGDFGFEYDVNFRQMRRYSGALTTTFPRLGMRVGWSQSRRLDADPAKSVVRNNVIQGSGRVELLARRLSVEGSIYHDLLNKITYQRTARVRYDVQCCGVQVERIEYNYNREKPEIVWRFSLELANIGSIGNFMADDPRRTGTGYR
jgi:LPS-assembly protein